MKKVLIWFGVFVLVMLIGASFSVIEEKTGMSMQIPRMIIIAIFAIVFHRVRNNKKESDK